ncbi:MAG: hypothetical protein KF891_06075 [Rhizobacter sp.]|nr:hypothetical protein [Rhizobacter sp.]
MAGGIPVESSARATPRWVLDIDYPALHRLDAYVLVQGRVVRQAVLGSHQPYSQRPLASRSHAMPVELARALRAKCCCGCRRAGR